MTIDEHLDRIATALHWRMPPQADREAALESLSVLRATIAKLERERAAFIDGAERMGAALSDACDSEEKLEAQIAALIVERDQARLTEEGAKSLLFTALRAKMDFEVRIASLEGALRNLVSAIGCCTCQPFWDKYDPSCAFHDCETEIIAARAALAPPATP